MLKSYLNLQYKIIKTIKINTMSEEIVKKETVQSLLASENINKRLSDILGKRASTFATSVIQISTQNTMLANAEPQSVVGAAMTAATLDLPLNNSLGYAYIIPFNEKQKDKTYLVKAQFQIGYKGFIQLAMRSGQFKTIHSTDIREGELKSRDRLTGGMIYEWIEDDTEREKAKIIGYVAYFKLLSGFESTFYMSTGELEAHGKKFSQTFKKGFGLWKDDFHSMAKKTVLKLLLSKYAPLSIDMQKAVNTDQSTIDVDAEVVSYPDNEIDPETLIPLTQEEIEEVEIQINECIDLKGISELYNSNIKYKTNKELSKKFSDRNVEIKRI